VRHAGIWEVGRMIVASLLAHLTTPEALSVQAILALLTALGLSSTAGIRAYLPLLALAIGSNIDSSALPLQPNFQTLKSPPLIIILAALTLLEIAVDKVPVIDHFSDAVHTVIRPFSGAIIMAGTQNSLSDISPWLAAGVGAVLALAFHTVKATSRPVVSATTAGVGNPIVSTIEDILAAVMSVLLIAAPIIGIILLVVLALLLVRLMIGVVRKVRGRRAGGVVPGTTAQAARGGRSQVPQPVYASGGTDAANPSNGVVLSSGSTLTSTYQPQAGPASPSVRPSPILRVPNVAPPMPTQPYPPAGGFVSDPPTMPGQMH
jgi:hypothetical protein